MKVDNAATEVNFQSQQQLQVNRKQSQSYIENVKCKEGKQCVDLCCSEGCEFNAVLCSDIKCQCRENHNKTKLCSKAELPLIVSRTEQKRLNQPELLEWVNEKYDKLIDWISDQREKIILKIKSMGLNKVQVDFMNNIYTGKCYQLTGDKVYQVFKNLYSQTNQFGAMEPQIKQRLEDLWKCSIEKIKKEIFTINENITDERLWQLLQIQLDSKVLITKAQRQTVNEMLSSCDKKVQKYKLLYRASENDFEISKFWEKCNQKKNTVTLIRTEFNKVIGGYNPVSWNRQKAGDYEQDSSLRSFLFSVTENTKFTLKQSEKQNAIHNGRSYGPCFGGKYKGCDIAVHNQANKETSQSFANIGGVYESNKVQYGTKEAWQFFQGSTQGMYFKIKEWQVWHVQFE